MDDDATFNMKLDKVVKPYDKFIVGKKRIDDDRPIIDIMTLI